MRHTLLVSALTASLVALAGAAAADHGWSSYDVTREMTLTGSIAEAGYEHPHGSVKLQESQSAPQPITHGDRPHAGAH